jgi:citrate lyase subunit beta/citryl-CoA lyase
VTARGTTWLFVPGDRPDRFTKAAASGADQVICDLEDAVAEDNKAAARDAVREQLAAEGTRCWVRINPAHTPWHRDDLDALVGLPGLAGIVVPKSESPHELVALRVSVGDGTAVVALIETAVGVVGAGPMAACLAVDRLAFGSLDFALDIGADPDDDSALLLARSTVVMASRVAGLPPPVDGVTPDVRDTVKVASHARRSRSLGFGAKLCIHPAQIAPVANAFAPSPDEVAWARQVVARAGSAGGAAAAADGTMIDRPVLARAQRIMASATPPAPGRAVDQEGTSGEAPAST